METVRAVAKRVEEAKKRGGTVRQALEGLWLIASRPYVLMLFLCSYAQLVPRTILDYRQTALMSEQIPDRSAQTAFMGSLNLWISCATAALTLLGTRTIVRRVGLGGCLLVLPAVCIGCIVAVSVSSSFSTSVAAVVLVSVMAYGLNSP